MTFLFRTFQQEKGDKKFSDSLDSINGIRLSKVLSYITIRAQLDIAVSSTTLDEEN